MRIMPTPLREHSKETENKIYIAIYITKTYDLQLGFYQKESGFKNFL